MEFLPLPDKTGYAYLEDPLDIAVIRLPSEIVGGMDPFHKFATLDILDPSDRLAPQPSPYMAFGYLSHLSGPGAVNYQTYSMFYFSAKY